ncbi:MAG TPA: hypothetical protein VHU17_04745 [Acidimicrobiales bacterium]|jgi:hypothetical protein|nr:hypothetical protein [Acidimicrobiales bacterium]
MELEPYVESIQRQLVVAAQAGGDETGALAERLLTPLDAALRLALQDVLVVAAEEITTELAPGSVELRLRGRDLELVVTPPPVDTTDDGPADGTDGTASNQRQVVSPGDVRPGASEGDESAMSRINLRMPDHVKARVEQAASADGLSVNAWLVRAASAALERTGPDPRRERRAWRDKQHYTGWAR